MVQPGVWAGEEDAALGVIAARVAVDMGDVSGLDNLAARQGAPIVASAVTVAPKCVPTVDVNLEMDVSILEEGVDSVPIAVPIDAATVGASRGRH